MHRIARVYKFIPFLVLVFVIPLYAQDPGNPDTVWVESIQIDPSPTDPVQFKIDVSLYNDEILKAGVLGFYYDSDDITADSVVAAGTRIEFAGENCDARPEDNLFIVGWVYLPFLPPPFAPLEAGNGVVGEAWFTLDAGAPDQYIHIDSGYYPPSGYFTLSDENAVGFVPQVVNGIITVGDPSLPPEIDVSPDFFNFDAFVGDPNPTPLVLNITNVGEGSLNWDASWESTWLSLSPSSGTAPSNPAVIVDIAGLSEGVYEDTIVVSCAEATNTPQKVPVTLTLVDPPPVIELDPTDFYFIAAQDDVNPDDQFLTINDIGGGTLSWEASNSESWLTLSSYTGGPDETITLMVDITGLSYGIYTDEIVVSDPNASNSPQVAEVVLEIVSSFPVLSIEPDEFVVGASTTEDPYDRTLYITNAGGGTLEYEVTSSELWMVVDPPSGSTASTDEITVSFNSAGMSQGFYYGTLTVTSANGSESPQTVDVEMWVMRNPPSMIIYPDQLTFEGFECDNVPEISSQLIDVTNLGLEDMNWNATWNSSWLSVSPTSGANEATLTVEVDETGLEPGVYKDTVFIDAQWSMTPDDFVEIIFTVNEQTAQPQLTTSTTHLKFVLLAGYIAGFTSSEIYIENAISGCMDWFITDPHPYLTFTVESGTQSGSTQANINPGGLPLGVTSGAFTVHSPGSDPEEIIIDFDLFIAQFGDANCDGIIDVSDGVYIIAYIQVPGAPPPIPELWAGDVNCDRIVDVSDAVYLFNYIFNPGDPPPCTYFPAGVTPTDKDN